MPDPEEQNPAPRYSGEEQNPEAARIEHLREKQRRSERARSPEPTWLADVRALADRMGEDTNMKRAADIPRGCIARRNPARPAREIVCVECHEVVFEIDERVIESTRRNFRIRAEIAIAADRATGVHRAEKHLALDRSSVMAATRRALIEAYPDRADDFLREIEKGWDNSQRDRLVDALVAIVGQIRRGTSTDTVLRIAEGAIDAVVKT